MKSGEVQPERFKTCSDRSLSASNPFCSAFRGHSTSLLEWEQLEAFWEVLRKDIAAKSSRISLMGMIC